MHRNPYLMGLAGAAAMFAVFFGITALAESLDYAWTQFGDLWPWIVLLAAGFGTQLGLHTYTRELLRQKQAQATAGVAASGGVSGLAMVACCAHRVTDILPFLGASAAAVFLVQYQTPFLVLGVFSNLLGILFMLRIMQKHGVGPKGGILKAALGFDMKKALVGTGAIGAVVVLWSVASVGGNGAGPAPAMATAAPGPVIAAAARTYDLPAVENRANGLAVEVEPIEFTLGQPARFRVALNTHMGSLDADMSKIAVLIDDRGSEIAATKWDGPPPGGHHIRGTIVFPPLGTGTKSFRLVIRNLYGAPERVFGWELR